MEDYDAYRKAHFTDPPPEQRFRFTGVHGLTLFYADYAQAVAFYSEALGPPAYVEGEGTKSWHVGDTFLTLLKGKTGNPTNVEVPFLMRTPAEADRLREAFVAAGATGPQPSDTLMHVPVRYCPLRDPLGVDVLVYSPLPD